MADDKKPKRGPGRPPSRPEDARTRRADIWVTAAEYTWLKRLGELRGETLSTMGRKFIFERVSVLRRRGTLFPSQMPTLPEPEPAVQISTEVTDDNADD